MGIQFFGVGIQLINQFHVFLFSRLDRATLFLLVSPNEWTSQRHSCATVPPLKKQTENKNKNSPIVLVNGLEILPISALYEAIRIVDTDHGLLKSSLGYWGTICCHYIK